MMIGKFAKIGSFFFSRSELGDARLENCNVSRITIPLDLQYEGIDVRETLHAVLEVFIPRGGHFLSGLLGMTFAPGASQDLEVHVSHGDAGKAIPSHLIPGRSLEVGLHFTLAAAIVKALNRDGDSLKLLGNGILYVNVGAQSEGSSEFVYERLTSAVISTLIKEGKIDDVAISLEKIFFSK